MKDVTFIFVGGFLGAGKTTLLGQAARKLAAQGKRVGLITNDQADDLVDTGMLQTAGLDVKEVSGGCFCCRFTDLIDAAEGLIDTLKPDILLGEPVGSCTDISATVLQPCKELYGDWFGVAPFSVLADPVRLRQALTPGEESPFPENVTYIYNKQLEEADVLVINKTDLVSAPELADLLELVEARFPDVTVLTMSALTEDGVHAWLKLILDNVGSAGKRIVEVDYDRYADGEAVLGWLNATVRLQADEETDWARFGAALLDQLRSDCASRAAEIAHLKLLVTTAGGSITANVTSTSDSVRLRGGLAEPTSEAAVTLNARIHMAPDLLRQLVEEALSRVSGDGIRAEIVHVQSLSPGRPEPIHRYGEVV